MKYLGNTVEAFLDGPGESPVKVSRTIDIDKPQAGVCFKAANSVKYTATVDNTDPQNPVLVLTEV